MSKVWSSKDLSEIPVFDLCSLSTQILSSYSGPDHGLSHIIYKQNKYGSGKIAGSTTWNKKHNRAYGISLSLYDQNPITGRTAGDPNADCFAICARRDSCIMIMCDGVNWGYKSKLAARSACFSAMQYLNNQCFDMGEQPESSLDVFVKLQSSIEFAHTQIIKNYAGLTTICVAMVCKVDETKPYLVCCANVGDSYAYLKHVNGGIQEITVGSHNIKCEQDIRDTGGAIGPVKGSDPELGNLTFSMSFADVGDIVFLTSDGISDNFDPVVAKLASSVSLNTKNPDSHYDSAKSLTSLEMEPIERHEFALKEMERVVLEYELTAEDCISAQNLCAVLTQYALLLTDKKRKVLENPEIYYVRGEDIVRSSKEVRHSADIKLMLADLPGKLDHASIVAYDVGESLFLNDYVPDQIPRHPSDPGPSPYRNKRQKHKLLSFRSLSRKEKYNMP